MPKITRARSYNLVLILLEENNELVEEAMDFEMEEVFPNQLLR